MKIIKIIIIQLFIIVNCNSTDFIGFSFDKNYAEMCKYFNSIDLKNETIIYLIPINLAKESILYLKEKLPATNKTLEKKLSKGFSMQVEFVNFLTSEEFNLLI